MSSALQLENVPNMIGKASQVWIGMTLMTLVVVGCIWFITKRGSEENRVSETDDPRLTSKTIYRNVRPDVHYLGDSACIGCHQEMAQSYHRHPMAQSLAPQSQAEPIE